jgi:hypothetical protein
MAPPRDLDGTGAARLAAQSLEVDGKPVRIRTPRLFRSPRQERHGCYDFASKTRASQSVAPLPTAPG